MVKKKELIVYTTMSGNTEEVAKLIEDRLLNKGIDVDILSIGINSVTPVIEDGKYRSIYIGTYTWDLGYAPEEISNFAEVNSFEDTVIHSFGTGETQFGDELFCVASDKVAAYYNSPSPVLKIEQSPRGAQEESVREWVDKIVNSKEGEIQ